jgi:RNA polymerase sporulation-specific sigma factor
MDQENFHHDDLQLAQSGDSRAFERLFCPVKPYAKGLAKRFFLNGWDKEDLYQEALAGFATALLTFQSGRGVGFHDFARMSMRNSVVACVRRATRAKRLGDAHMASLEGLDRAPSDQFRPDLLVEQQSGCAELLASLKNILSEAEWTVLKAVMAGSPLAEVALEVGANLRAVENALSRARVKARRLLRAA